MFRPARMSRVAIAGLKEDRPRVISVLYEFGAVQVEELSEEARSLLKKDAYDMTAKEVCNELFRIRALKSALPPAASQEKRGFASMGEVLHASVSITIDRAVRELKLQQERLLEELEQARDTTELVRDLVFVEEDLVIFDLSSAASFYGRMTRASFLRLQGELRSALSKAMVISSAAQGHVKVICVVSNEELEKFASIIQKMDLRLARIPKLSGTPGELLSSLAKKKEELEDALRCTRDELAQLSAKYYGMLSSVEEQLSIESRKLEVLNRLGLTADTFALEGWVPRREVARLESMLLDYLGSRVFVCEIQTGQKPPTLLANPRSISPFEPFVRFYSLPQSTEFDPTLLFALVFPVFFGFMIGDAGYALFILLLSIWVTHRLAHHGRRVVPARLGAFVRMIFSPSFLRRLAMAMTRGAVLGILFGVLFDEYFGFHLNGYVFSFLDSAFHLSIPVGLTLLDPLSPGGFKTLLLASLYVGLTLVSTGLVIGALNSFWYGEYRRIFGRVGWLLVAWWIVLFGMTLVHHGDLNPTTNVSTAAIWGIFAAGIVSIVAGESARSLMEFPSIVSHIFSYTRLTGILLASVILADIFNSVFVRAAGGGFPMLIVAIMVLVAGHAFNLTLAFFEPTIQGARLLYVETFSEFFRGFGRPFMPLGGKRVHTLSELEPPLVRPPDQVAILPVASVGRRKGDGR